MGRYFYENQNKLYLLKHLDDIDWARSNPDWAGRVIDAQGKIRNNEDAIIKICNFIKKSIGINLIKEERLKEQEI